MRDIAVVSIARTPVGKANKGTFRDTRPDTLIGLAIKEALNRAPGLDPAMLGDVIVGCAFPEGDQGMNVARVASFLAGIPNEVPAMTVNRFCSSGLQSLASAAGRIALGGIDAAIAGGVECMSAVPMGGGKPSANPELFNRYPEAYANMGITAEEVARRFDVTREVQDEVAYNSNIRAAAAVDGGKFDQETFPVATQVFTDDGPQDVTLSRDEGPRANTTLEGLAKLRPVFDVKGTVTAGNSSQVSDGAGAAVLMTVEKAEELGIKPLAIFRNFVVVGVDPDIMGIGPLPAIRKLWEVSGLTDADIGTYEINEAFAAQAAYCVRELGIDPAKVNPNGGAIALGHPLGGTGTILTAKVLHEMMREDHKYGVVSMCIGGGMGAAGLFEKV